MPTNRYHLPLMLLLCSGVFFRQSQAQQIFKVSQYVQHNFMFNPAAAGVAASGSVGLMYKKMWSGIEGGPQTTLLYADRYFEKLNTGAAVVLYNDITGVTARTGLDINAAYALQLDEGKKLHIGLNALVLQERVDKLMAQQYIPNDPLLAGPGSKITADAGAGIYYASPTLNAGISVKQIVQSKLGIITGKTDPEGRLYRHYYFTASYNWKTDEDNVIIPNMMLRFTRNMPADLEVGAMINHKNLVWMGFGWHYRQSFSAYCGLNVHKRYSIGYAFDQYKTPLSIFDGGSGAHELTLRYFLKN